MSMFDFLYDELVKISREILPYYDIDKIKPYAVYVWSKGENSENVFDIFAGRTILYAKNHVIKEEAKPIIRKIQLKLKEIAKCL
ncbi:hypothetical protein [Clostridium sp.]|uniref:hypothetical protein n=1 Tax=Clostridium sp. TaxID=1506 RepID=UPI0035A024A0